MLAVLHNIFLWNSENAEESTIDKVYEKELDHK